eukprot:scaffold16421_cov51-Attheya_sp.AAC.7
MSHEGDGTPEEGAELLGGRLAQNFHNGLGFASLLEEGTLLLLDHANGVDKGSTEDGGACSRHHAHISIANQKGDAEQNAELGHPLEADSHQPRTHARHAGTERMSPEDSLGLSARETGFHSLARRVLGILLHQLTIRCDWIVHDRLKAASPQIGSHSLKLRQASLLHDEIFIGNKGNAEPLFFCCRYTHGFLETRTLAYLILGWSTGEKSERGSSFIWGPAWP